VCWQVQHFDTDRAAGTAPTDAIRTQITAIAATSETIALRFIM
jgi:hypothetical protein